MPLLTIPLGQLSESEFVKQLSIRQQKILITTSLGNLFEYGNNSSEFKKCSEKIRSAVYNTAGDEIIALMTDCLEDAPEIKIFKSGSDFSQVLNNINLDFKDQVKNDGAFNRNEFRAYCITEHQNGTSFIQAAFYESQSDKDDNIGCTIIFILNEELGSNTNFT